MSGNDPLPGPLSSPVFRPDDRRANLRPARSPGRTFAAALMAALVVAFAVIALTRPAVPDLKIQNPTVAAATALAEVLGASLVIADCQTEKPTPASTVCADRRPGLDMRR